MNKRFRSQFVLAAAVLLAGSVCFAEDGAAIYKAKCAMCHGPTGTPSAGMAKMMGIKPVSDPAIRSISEAQVEAQVKNGKGKMKPFSGKLTDDQIKDVVTYFRTLK